MQFQGVSYRYEGSDELPPALDAIDLQVAAGGFVAVVGANGSGKSTLARLCDGLLLPTRGRVLVDGLDTADASARWEVRRRVGLVFQNPDNQIVASVVEDDVAFGPENLGLPPAEIRERVDAALQRVGLQDLRRRSPDQLSGGQKQRVAIAGALAMHPRVLVLDEATSMLDPVGRDEVLAVLERLRAGEGITIVLVTHQMEEAARAERIVVLAGGRLMADEAPATLFATPGRLQAWGIELPPAAAMAARLRQAGLAIPPAAVTVDSLAAALQPLLPRIGRGRPSWPSR